MPYTCLCFPYEYKHVKTVSEVIADGFITFSQPVEEEYVDEEYAEPSEDMFSLFTIVNGKLVYKNNYKLTLFNKE